MKSLKDVLKKKVTQWQQAHTTPLSKYIVVPLIHSLVGELLTSRPHVIGNGFCHASLVPWNPAAVDQKKMLPSLVFRPPVLLESNVSQDLIDPQPGPSGYHHERNLLPPGNHQQQDVDLRPHSLNIEQIDLDVGQETSFLRVDWGKLKLIPDSQEEGLIDSFDEQANLSEVFEVKPSVIQDEEVPKFDHPVFSSRHHSTFEGVFLLEEQVIKYKDMFLRGVMSSNPFSLAWKAFKAVSLPTENETLDSVLSCHKPKNIPKRKAHRGRKVPGGATCFDPTSKEWRDILDPPEEIITTAK